MSFHVEAACGCCTGKVRRNNEDNFYFGGRLLEIENNGLPEILTLTESLQGDLTMAVFDGMGGENYGEVASFVAAKRLKELLDQKDDAAADERALEEQCLKLNAAVVDKERELYTEHMGTTMVSLCLTEKTAYISNLGDSRAYSLHDGSLEQLSEDHVEMLRPGRKKAPLSQHLGIPEDDFLIEPSISSYPLRAGDQYLLCSDGLTDMLTDEEICCIMATADSTPQCVRQLTDAALANGGRDNITVIVCRILEDESAKIDRESGRDESAGLSTKKKRLSVLFLSISACSFLLLCGYLFLHSWIPASCTEAEKCLICGKTRGEALAHSWGAWSTIREPSCTECGVQRRICFNDPTHTEEENIAALGHNWGDPSYSWSEDNSAVTARRVCLNDADHVEEERVMTDTDQIDKTSMRYTAQFNNPAFEQQSRSISSKIKLKNKLLFETNKGGS